MILPHPLLDQKIDKSYIDLVAEREGYELFIPYTFVEHLIYAFSFYKVKRSPYESIQDKNDYTKEFSRLLGMIRFEDVRTDNPVIFAIRVLKIIAKKVNLRSLERSAITGIKVSLEDNDQYTNYKFDICSLTTNQLATIQVDSSNLDTVELSPEVQKLLLMYEGLQLLEPTFEPEYNVVKKQLTSYNDFYKGKKYKLTLPTFGIDLGTKRLQITKVEDSEVLVSEVILAIDCSISMSDHKLSGTLIRSVLLYYIKQLEQHPGLTITILYLIGEISAVHVVTKIEELQALFRQLPVFTLPVRHSNHLLVDIGEHYSGRSVVFISDGRLNLSYIPNLKYKLYTIALTENHMLKQTCLISGGQYIILR